MIEAQLTLTEDVILKGFLLHFKHNQRALRFAPLIGGILVIVTLVNLFQTGSFFSILPTLLPGLFLVGMPYFLRYLAQRNVRKLPTLGKEMTWQLNKQGVSGSTAGNTFSQTWASMEEALIADDGFLLYSQKIVANWIPKSAFASEADFQQAQQLIQAGVKKYKFI